MMALLVNVTLERSGECVVFVVEEGKRVLPVFPLPGAKWTGHSVEMTGQIIRIGEVTNLGGGWVTGLPAGPMFPRAAATSLARTGCCDPISSACETHASRTTP
jgi:hypothetical protein